MEISQIFSPGVVGNTSADGDVGIFPSHVCGNKTGLSSGQASFHDVRFCTYFFIVPFPGVFISLNHRGVLVFQTVSINPLLDLYRPLKSSSVFVHIIVVASFFHLNQTAA